MLDYLVPFVEEIKVMHNLTGITMQVYWSEGTRGSKEDGSNLALLSPWRRFGRELGRHREKERGVWAEPHPSQKAKNLCAVSVGSPAGCDAHHPGSGRHHFTWPFFLPAAGCRETEWVCPSVRYSVTLCPAWDSLLWCHKERLSLEPHFSKVDEAEDGRVSLDHRENRDWWK